VFRNNSTTLSQIEWNEKYNLSYATKLVATMEEAKFKNGAMIDRLKALATDKKIRIREMRMDSYEVDYYCKFILSSNHEKDFISIDGDEIRFWIRKIGQVKFIDGFFDKLKSEIPAFLYFLENRTMSTKPESRMWFKPSLIKTKELDTVKINSIDENSKSIISYLYDRLGTDFEYKSKSKTKGDEIRTKTEYISTDTRIKRSLIPKIMREIFGSNLHPSPVRMTEGKPVQKCWCIPISDIENKYNEIFG
jgi:hypothetical protein